MTLPRVGALLLSVGGAGFLLGSQLRFGRQQVEKEWPWVALGLVLGIFVKVHMSQPYTGQRILSPRLSVLPGLKADEIASLSYPPGAFPGSRDVDSPYGSLRVYEWGPLDGTRILLIHGISTPCLSLGRVAHGLVERGHRVMLFDLWGRGYSDAPQDVPQDMRLFSYAILLALATSDLYWTGTSSFTIVGYSLGGGIATNFTSFFPQLVSYLILIAPSGLVRKEHISRTSKVLYSTDLLPEFLIEKYVKKKLGSNPSAAVAVKSKPTTPTSRALEEEVPSREQANKESTNILSQIRPGIAAQDAVAWQVRNHQGFVKAFISSIRYGPIHGQHARWRLVGDYYAMAKPSIQDSQRNRTRRAARVLVVCGDDDPIVIRNEIFEDACHALGSDNVELRSCNAGHELPMTHSGEIVEMIANFLERE